MSMYVRMYMREAFFVARISEEDINRVKEATDAVALVGEYVQLRQRGRDFWGCCPFHGEKTPSFKVSPQTQMWHCFGCGEGGNVFKFLMMKEQFEFPEAVRFLAARANITIHEEEGGMPSGHRARLFAVCDETAKFYHTQLMRGKSDSCAKAREYMASRNLGGSIPNKWNLGYAPGSNSLTSYLHQKGFSDKEMIDANVALRADRGGLRDRFYNRVMFPIRDLQGRTIAFGGRVIGQGEPKYINTSNCPLFSKRNNLFGIDFAKSKIVTLGAAIVVEGYTDVIAMHEAGFENVVATLGTALTPQHIKLLTRFTNRIVYLFDGDAAGQKAADRASELITSTVAPESGSKQVALEVVVIPNNMYPAEYVASAGQEGMQQLLKNSQPLLRFVIDRRLASCDLSTPEQRALALPKVLEPLVPIRDSILADEYVNYLADVFKVDFERMKHELATVRPPRIYTPADNEAPVDAYEHVSDESNTDESSASKFVIPSNGAVRWEAEIVNVYALHPSVRSIILQEMQEQHFSVELLQQCFDLMTQQPTDTKPSQLVMYCMQQLPQSEPIWNMTVFMPDDLQAMENTVRLMLKERNKAVLEDSIAELERKVKYDNLTEQQSSEIFNQIVQMQKQLSTLRK